MPTDPTDAAAGNGLPSSEGAPPHDGLGREDLARRFQEAHPVLWTIAAAILGETSRAEDVLQESAVIALSKQSQFEPGTSFVAWMGTIVRNVARNEARKTRRRATHAVEPETLAEIHVAPEAVTEGARVVDARGELLAGHGAFDDALTRALADLRPIQRAALLLRTVRELDYREISQALDIPEGTAMSHVHRARQALRLRLTEDEATAGLRDAETGDTP